MTTYEWEAGVGRFDCVFEVITEGLIDIEEDDLAARRHDIFDGDVIKLEGIDEDFSLSFGDLLLAFAFFNKECEFFSRVDSFAFGYWVDFEDLFEKKIRGVGKGDSDETS